jgi:hypothetical protein
MRSAEKICAVMLALFFWHGGISISGLAQDADTDVPHEEQIFELRILDGESRGFLSSAEVWLRGRGENEWSLAGKTTNGVVCFDTSEIPEFELMVKEEQFSTYRSVRLHAAALGGELVIEMSRHPIVCARLIAPFPEMAATFLIGPERQTPLYLGPPYNIADGSFEETGRFFIELNPAASAVVVVHNIGFACIPIAACFEGMEITLQPWQTLRGRLLKNGKPAANEKIVATRLELPYASIQLAGENFIAETDAAGRFIFDHTIPSGRVTLVAFEQIQKTFAVPEGKTTEINFDCVGKEIDGSLSYVGPERIDWSVSRTYLFACCAAPEPQAFDNPPDDRDDEECYGLDTNSNGTFGAPMIPPGSYKLLLTCAAIEDAVEPPDQPRPMLTFSGNIVVSAGEKPEKFHVMLTKEEQTIDEP